MPTHEIIIRIATGFLLTVLNAFFVLVEFSLTRLRQFDRSEMENSKRLKKAWEMTEKLEIYLTGCQLGITSSSILLGVIAEPAVTALIEPAMDLLGSSEKTTSTVSVVIAVIIINLIHKIWGEQAPTYLGIERPLQVARYLAPIHYWWTNILYPVIIMGDSAAKLTLKVVGVEISRSWAKKAEGEGEEAESKRQITPQSDLRTDMANLLRQSEELPADRKQEVLKSLDIDKIAVKKIMVKDIHYLSVDYSLEKNMKIVSETNNARYPLRKNKNNEYLGNIYVTSLLNNYEKLKAGKKELTEIITGKMLVHDEMPVSVLIDEFQEQEQELALVENQGGIVGLVTLTMALEAIVGEAKDPLDVE